MLVRSAAVPGERRAREIVPGSSWRSTQEEGRHRGPLAGERAAWTGGLEGSTFFPDCAYTSSGPERLSSCFASVMLDSVFCVFILKLVSRSPGLPCSFLSACCHGEVSWGWKLLSLSVSAFLDPPAASCPSTDGGGAGPHWVGSPFLCRDWSCISIPFGVGVSFICVLTQQLCRACLCGPGMVLCSASTKMTVARGWGAGGRVVVGGRRGETPHPAGQFFHTYLSCSVLQPHSFLEFRGLCVLLLQPLSLLI